MDMESLLAQCEEVYEADGYQAMLEHAATAIVTVALTEGIESFLKDAMKSFPTVTMSEPTVLHVGKEERE